MKAILRSIRISPKKVNLVAKLIRGKSATWAIDYLSFTPKHSAHPLMQTLKSAVANAQENFKQDKKDLIVSKVIVNEGFTLKRFRPASRGRSQPIRKRTTHITIEVSVRPGMSTASKMAEQESKAKVIETTATEVATPKAKKAASAKKTTKKAVAA